LLERFDQKKANGPVEVSKDTYRFPLCHKCCAPQAFNPTAFAAANAKAAVEKLMQEKKVDEKAANYYGSTGKGAPPAVGEVSDSDSGEEKQRDGHIRKIIRPRQQQDYGVNNGKLK